MSHITHIGRGYIRKGSQAAARSARRTSKYRLKLGPKANAKQKARIRELYRHGYSASQISRALKAPIMRKRTGGKQLKATRVRSILRKPPSRYMKHREAYLKQVREKWAWKYGGRRLPPAKNRLAGLMVRLGDSRFALRLEREGYSLP